MLNYKVQKKDLFFIFIIAAAALFFRAAYLADYLRSDIFPQLDYSDAYYYSLWAKDIASGDLWGSRVFMKWPFYAYFLSFLFKLSGNSMLSVYCFQFILGAVSCILAYFIAKSVFNEITGFIAGLLCACYGLFIFYDGLLIYSSLSIFLNSLLFLFILHAQDNPNRKKLFWIGILLGVCTLTQGNIIIFGISAVLWILRQEHRQAGSSRGNLAYLFFSFLLGLCIVIGPVTIRNYSVDKDFVFITANTGINFYLGNNPEAQGTFDCPENITLNQEDMFRDARIIARQELGRQLKDSEVSDFWFKKAAGFIRKEPRQHLKLLLRKISYLLNPSEPVHDLEFQFIKDKIRIFKVMFMDLKFFLPLGLLGALLGLKNFKKTVFLYIMLITLAFSIIIFFVTARYRTAMVPFLIIFASHALVSFWKAVREKRYLVFCLLCTGLVLIYVLLSYANISYRNIEKNAPNNFSDFNFRLIKALNYENRADYQAAMQELNSAEAMKPLDRRVLFRQGVVYFYLQNFKTAEEKFKEVIKNCPFCVDAYYNLGFLYNQQRRFNEAVQVLGEAVYLDPENIAANFELGIAYKALGRKQEAGERFEFVFRNIRSWRTADRKIIEKELLDLEIK